MIRDVDSFNIDMAQSNIFQKSDNIEADFEMTTFDFTYYFIVNREIEISFNYPFYYISKGFLDDFLDSVHSTLQIATTRENEGHINNQLNYKITDTIYKTESYFVTGNPQLEIKYNLYNKNEIYLSTNFGIKIPMGNSEDGFTTNKIDIMSAIQFQKNYNLLSFVTNAVVTLNATHKLSSDIISEKYRYFISQSMQFNFFNKSDFLFTYQYSSAPYKSHDEKFSSHTHLLQFAIRENLKDGKYIDLFFNQNTIPRHNEADVTFGVSYCF